MKPIKERKKPTIGSIVLFVIIVVVILVLAVAVLAYWRYVYPTGRIMPGLYTLRIHNNGMPMGNFFLVQTGDNYIAIDTGGDLTETENGLRKLGISTDDIIAVFITHAHWDHIGGISLFNNATFYTGNTDNSAFLDIPHQVMMDGEIIEISGTSIQCIYTPGHTIDHVCYLVEGKNLFAGDLFVTTNDSPFEKRYNKELQLEYRDRVLGIDGIECVFTGHFGLFKSADFFKWWYR